MIDEYRYLNYHPDSLLLKYRPNRNVCNSTPKDTYKDVNRSAIYNRKTQ